MVAQGLSLLRVAGAWAMMGGAPGSLTPTEVARMLDGYRVLDLTDEKGHLCARILGDLGADVLKVEPPTGDPGRRFGPFFHDTPDPRKSLSWFAYNTNKRSVTLDLESVDGRELFRALVRTADLVVESGAPGYLASLSLGYEQLQLLNPRLVMTSITPFGQTGPDRLEYGTDLILMARGGLLNISGEADGPPARIKVSQSYCHAGGQAAMASLLALHQRDETGGLGQHIDLSIQEAVGNAVMTAPQSWDLIRFEEGRGTKQRRGNVIGRYSWKCMDGYINWCWWVAPGWGDKTVPVVAWMAEEEMAEDLLEVDWEGKSTADLTQQEVDHWEEVFDRFFQRFTKAQIYEQALKRRIMLFPTFSIADLAHYAQLEARKYYTPVLHPDLGVTVAYPGPFVDSAVGMWALRRRPPLPGEHNEEVYLGELGLTRNDLAALKAAGAV